MNAAKIYRRRFVAFFFAFVFRFVVLRLVVRFAFFFIFFARRTRIIDKLALVLDRKIKSFFFYLFQQSR
ncbi:MAG: hypothetical protein AAB726_01295, partial [Patescibacteria group bacterium]